MSSLSCLSARQCEISWMFPWMRMWIWQPVGECTVSASVNANCGWMKEDLLCGYDSGWACPNFIDGSFYGLPICNFTNFWTLVICWRCQGTWCSDIGLCGWVQYSHVWGCILHLLKVSTHQASRWILFSLRIYIFSVLRPKFLFTSLNLGVRVQYEVTWFEACLLLQHEIVKSLCELPILAHYLGFCITKFHVC